MPRIYLAMDGDDAGEAVTEAILHGTEQDAIDFSESIKKAFFDITDWVTDAGGGKIIFEGGDNILFTIDTDDTQSVADTARGMYKHHTGHSATAGVGSSIQEAHKSLVVGKNTGKDKTVVWNEATADLYEVVREKEQRVKEFEEQEKVKEPKAAVVRNVQWDATAHYNRLVGQGYSARRAKFITDRLYVYGKSKRLPGNTDAEKYLIDGETEWGKFLEGIETEAKEKEAASLVIGQKVVVGGKLGIIRRIGKVNLSVELMDTTGITVPLNGDYKSLPAVRA